MTSHTIFYIHNNLICGGGEFENQRAVLLPEVSQLFLKEYLECTDVDSDSQEHTLENKEGTIKFTARWLLKQLKVHLKVHLHSHMNSKCIHKKFGTLLYRKGGALLTSWWALARAISLSSYWCLLKHLNFN